MPKKEYDWHIGEKPPEINLHSLAKHRVYEEYLSHYIRVLNTNPRIPTFSLAIIDGFAGGGVYTDPRDNSLYPGSPLRLVRAAEAAEALVNLERQQGGVHTPFTLQAEYFFVEKKKSNHDHLDWYLSQEGLNHRFGKDIFLLKDEFTKRLEEVVQYIEKRGKSRRCLFFLDQYGYKHVPFNDIRMIFSRLPNAEIILTFAMDALIDYMSEDPRWLKSLEEIEIPKKLDIDKLLKEKEDNKDWRQVVQFVLHRATWSQSGAGYYTPFFIKSDESNRSYWLIHLSNHPKARDVMTEVHWRLKNHFSHYGGPGLWMFGYDPKQDHLISGQLDLFSETEYSFDETAKEKTRQAIIEELPGLIYQYPNGIPYPKLYQRVANTTPATSEHIKEVATLLLQAKELEAIGPNNEYRHTRIKKDDILRIRQITVFGTSSVSGIVRSRNKKKD
uniref:Three-Cys-motif partner protein n=1 Tax=Candidatus Kentrum sp. FW TaxID=2126338 RepID=A0A450T895_9GAMM|nr:MAG: three-Cys-motif partner protein [Candidatus Kentron sp. FW]